MERKYESVVLEGKVYVVTEVMHGVRKQYVKWLCAHVSDLLDAGQAQAGVSCDTCGGSACVLCIQNCSKCQQVLCPVCKDRHNNGLCD